MMDIFSTDSDKYKAQLLKLKLLGYLNDFDFNNTKFFILTHNNYSSFTKLCDDIIVFNINNFIRFRFKDNCLRIDTSNNDLQFGINNKLTQINDNYLEITNLNNVKGLSFDNAEFISGQREVTLNKINYLCSANSNIVDYDEDVQELLFRIVFQVVHYSDTINFKLVLDNDKFKYLIFRNPVDIKVNKR